jgi:hypothetical protein
MPLLLLLVFLAALFVWLFSAGARARRRAAAEPPDLEELEDAEREVRDLDLHQDPEAGFEGDDWGPGAPKRSSR